MRSVPRPISSSAQIIPSDTSPLIFDLLILKWLALHWVNSGANSSHHHFLPGSHICRAANNLQIGRRYRHQLWLNADGRHWGAGCILLHSRSPNLPVRRGWPALFPGSPPPDRCRLISVEISSGVLSVSINCFKPVIRYLHYSKMIIGKDRIWRRKAERGKVERRKVNGERSGESL